MKIRAFIIALLVWAACVPCRAADNNEKDHVVRILAIGNSFSEDALDYHFNGLCRAAGKKVVVGNLFIGGCALNRHLLNARTDSAAYRFRRIGLDGSIITAQKVKLGNAIASDDWDFVSFQQSSGVSGKYASYASLTPLIEYVDSLTPDKTKFVWHQTWAYSPDSKHKEYVNYGADQSTMYDSIIAVNKRIMAENPALKVVVPSGTAVQTARSLGGNPDLTRDGYHLDKLIGRYIAACAWFEAIFGEPVTDNTFVPEGLDPELARMAREAAHRACAAPFGPTK